MTAEIEIKDRIINRVKSKIAEMETAQIEECLYNSFKLLLENELDHGKRTNE